VSVALPLSSAGLASRTVINEIIEKLTQSGMPGRLLHFVIDADALMREESSIGDGLAKLRQAGCRLIISHIGRDLEIFNHLMPQMADYVLLEPELVNNVHGNLMDEMMVTIVQGHAHRLGMKSIAGPTNQPMMMDTLSGIGIDYIFGDTISQAQPLDLMLNTSYFAIN
ncbi:EAL domain-containing protein, partial [Escherichia coli O8:H10]